MTQRGGAVHPRNKEFKRLELEMKHDNKRREIIREKESGKLNAGEASMMLLSESMKYLSDCIRLESKLSPNLADLQAQADHFRETREDR